MAVYLFVVTKYYQRSLIQFFNRYLRNLLLIIFKRLWEQLLKTSGHFFNVFRKLLLEVFLKSTNYKVKFHSNTIKKYCKILSTL